MNLNSNDLSLSLSRRQKRLKYWRDTLLSLRNKNRLKDNSEIKKLEVDLEIYSTILKKVVSEKDSVEFNNLENRLLCLESNFNNVFSYKRLLTSDEGIPAIEE